MASRFKQREESVETQQVIPVKLGRAERRASLYSVVDTMDNFSNNLGLRSESSHANVQQAELASRITRNTDHLHIEVSRPLQNRFREMLDAL